MWEVQTETIAPHPHTPSYSYNLTEDQIVKYRVRCLHVGKLGTHRF